MPDELLQSALATVRFLIVQDVLPSPLTERAHVVLPSLTFAEKDGTFTLGTIGHTSKGRSQLLSGAVEGEFYVNIRPAAGSGDDVAPPVRAGKAAFTLKKTYKVEAKESNELTIVIE